MIIIEYDASCDRCGCRLKEFLIEDTSTRQHGRRYEAAYFWCCSICWMKIRKVAYLRRMTDQEVAIYQVMTS